MATMKEQTEGLAEQVIDAVQRGEKEALEAVRRFVDTVDSAFPDGESGPRRKIIDSAFRMVEQVLKASNDFAQNITRATEETLEAPEDKTSA